MTVDGTAMTGPTLNFQPLYDQVGELIAARLVRGEWKPGAALPSEAALAREYNVSQGTMRKALNGLEAKHLVDRRQGRGTYAAQHTPERSLFQFFRLFGEDGAHHLPDSRTLRCSHGVANAEERAALDLAKGADVTRIHRVRLMDGERAIAEQITLPTERFTGLHQLAPVEIPNAVYALYEERFGVTIVRAVEHLRAVAASAADAQLLGIEPGAPLLEISRVAVALDGKPVEWRVSRCDTHRHYYLSAID